MNDVQRNKPLSLNLDKSPKYLSETECFYLLNHERYLNQDGTLKGSLGKSTPLVANSPACEVDQPDGENPSIGEYYCEQTNELYSWIYNSNEVHYIQRINGDGTCQIVYYGCLKLSAEPQHAIKQFRAYLQVDKLCANRHGKTLIWVDGNEVIGCLDVEASIATNNFTTPFFDRCADKCELIQLCVPDPCGCLKGEFVPSSPDDKNKKNNIVNVGIKLFFKHEYYDGRQSIWSDPSTLFYQDAQGCFDNADGLPRCIKVRVPVGNPLVEKIIIGFWKNGTWYEYDTVEKYKKYNSTQQYWYERELAELTNYSDDDCSFDYLFCNDKQYKVIDTAEVNRVFNPMPIKPQALIPIGIGQDRTALGFLNYEQGNCPIDKSEIEKFDVGIVCDNNTCDTEYVTLIVRAIVHNTYHNLNQFVYRMNGNDGANDDDSDAAFFGGMNGAGDLEVGYDQRFRDKTRNFIAYCEGTNIWGEMKQWTAGPNLANPKEVGPMAGLGERSNKAKWRRYIQSGNFFYQEVKLKVIKGSKGFIRLTSHEATGNDQGKSTYVIGVYNDLANYRGNQSVAGPNIDLATEEIYFDTCGITTQEYDLKKIFFIQDNAVDAGLSTKAYAVSGYVKDANGLPVEGAVIKRDVLLGPPVAVSVTDHNGFYHYFKFPGSNGSADLSVYVEQDCFNFTEIKSETVNVNAGAMTHFDITIDNETYKNGFYATVKWLITDCAGVPVSGVRAAISGSKYKISGADGYILFRIRNYEARNRSVRVVLLDNNRCISSDCNGDCNPCLPTGFSGTANCYISKPVITMSTAKINTNPVYHTTGLKAGGRYPFGFFVRFGCGQVSAVNKIKYLDIPRTQEKNKESFCSLEYHANGIKLPAGAKCLTIVRGENVNPFELQWIIDKIERTTDGKLKLTIQSLNDYNEKYLFKTNTIYQWLKGDRIEFVKNGDGKIFQSSIYGDLNFLTISPFAENKDEEAAADFFNQLLINDDPRLSDLKEGAVIELQRSKECLTDPKYFSICVSIPVREDGTLEYPDGTFHTFDTYFVNRQIGTLPAQQFEHHSPSDFWGDKITDAGRPYFVNKYENKRRYGRNITLNSPTIMNYFGDFVKKFDPDMHGDLIAMYISDNKIGLAISERDNSLFEIGNDFLKVDGSGVVRAVSPDAIISDGEPKLRGMYGCRYEDIGSIFFGDGFATWNDGNNGRYIRHDYQQAVAIDEGKAESYFAKRSRDVAVSQKKNTDPLNKLRWISGMNYHTGALHITIRSLRDPAIYNETKPYQKQYDTIMYHPTDNDFLGFASFVPEGYGRLQLFDDGGCAFVSFYKGVPYIHPVKPDKWNEFYGQAVDRVVGIALNKHPQKIKKGLAIELQDEMLWFVVNVSIENINFSSEIPAIRWKKDGTKWNAAFLRNANGRGGLYNGEPATDFYHAVTFVRDNTDNLQYNTIDNAKRIKYDSLDQILFKFMFVEQSGFTENI